MTFMEGPMMPSLFCSYGVVIFFGVQGTVFVSTIYSECLAFNLST